MNKENGYKFHIEIWREVIIILFLGELLCTYYLIYSLSINKVVLFALISITALLNYLIIFFVWSRERQEEYTPEIKCNGILEFSLLYVFQVIFFVFSAFTQWVILEQFIIVFIGFICITLMIRYMFVFPITSKDNVLTKDISTVIPLGIFHTVAIGLVVLASGAQIQLAMAVIVYSNVVLTIIWLYSVKCANFEKVKKINSFKGCTYLLLLALFQIVSLIYLDIFVIDKDSNVYLTLIIISGIAHTLSGMVVINRIDTLLKNSC